MSRSKVQAATSADWSFLDDGAVVRAVKYAAIRAARAFDVAEYDDCRQDALLWLSVRPELIAKYRSEHGSGEDFVKLLGYRIYSDALREKLISNSDKAHLQERLPEEAHQ